VPGRDGEGDLSDELIVRQVFDGRKPLGGVCLSKLDRDWVRDRERAEALASETRSRGLAARVIAEGPEAEGYEGPPDKWGSSTIVWITMSQRGTLGELFDLDALAEDWRLFFPGGGLSEVVAGLLAEARAMRLEEFTESAFSFDDVPAPLTGLVLGYPVWSSAAFMSGDAALSSGQVRSLKQAAAKRARRAAVAASAPTSHAYAQAPSGAHRCPGRTLKGERYRNVVTDGNDHCEAGHRQR
jgi:hypothetical protein